MRLTLYLEMVGIKMESREKNLIKDTGIFAIGNFASKILTFLLVPLYTNILTTEDYGISSLITTTISLLYPVLTLAIGESMLRFSMDKEENSKKVFSLSLLLMGMSVLLVLCGTFFIQDISGEIADYWLYFVVYYAVYMLQDGLAQYVKGLGYIKLYALQGVAQTLVLVLMNVLFLVVMNRGLEGFLLATILGYTAAIVVTFFGGRLYRQFELGMDTALIKRMIVYSLPMVPTQVGWWLNGSLDKYMLVAMRGYDVNGIYSVAQKIPSILTVFISIFTQAWVLSVINSFEDKDFEQYFSKVHNLFISVGVVGCGGLILFSKVLGQILFAKDFVEAWHYVPYLTVATFFSSYSIFLSSVFRAAKRTTSIFVATIVGSIVNLVLNIILIPTMGCGGAAIATAAGFASMCIMRLYLMHTFVKLNYSRKLVLAEYLILLVMATVITYEILACWIVAVALFVILVFVNRNTVMQMFTILKNKVTK